MNAGDVLFFMDGPLAHGALAWRSRIPRRAVLLRYSSRHFNSGSELVLPRERWGEIVEGMTDEQLAVMRGPDRDQRDYTVPRLVVRDGRVEVFYERRAGAFYTRATPAGARDLRDDY